MGRVWRAADEMLDRQVAVKEMRIDGLDPEDTRTRRERTLREARATARIDHPNVVRIYDVVDEGERLWIVMELVAGRSLEQIVVEDGPLDPREAARIGLELVAALRQVHAGGVLHRDIKPGNVLVERHGRRVVLTDFGIAALQDAEALTMVGMLVGSPDYMAPERISGRPQGPPSDVWSLGATLCAALGGRSPFSRSTTLATLHAVLYEEPELPASAGDLRDILAALLEKDPSTRPGLEELEAELGARVYGPVPEAPPTPDTQLVPEPAPEPVRERETAPLRERETAPEPTRAESPTPALLDAELIRAARESEPDPKPDPEPDPEPEPGQGPARGLGPGPGQGPAPGPGPGAIQESAPQPVHEPGLVHEPAPGPAPVRAPAPLREPEPEPAATEPEPVHDAIPIQRTPTRKSPQDTPDSEKHPAHPPRPARQPSASASASASEAVAPLPEAPQVANASTEVPSTLRAEVGSPIPSTGAPEGSAQAVREATRERVTEARLPTVPAPVGTPPGELPGPAVAPGPRGSRRRMGLAAAGAMAVAGAVAGIVIATSGGSPDARTGASSGSPAPTASSGSTTSDGTTSGSTTSGSTSPASTSPTVEGTSRPPSLPPGAHQEAGGYAWVTPKGWRRDVKTGSEVHYTSPDAKQELAAKSALAKGDLMQTWQTSEQNARQGRYYRKIRLDRTTFQGRPAVVWEYTFTLKGEQWHALLLGFDADGTSYQINTWYRPDIENEALQVYQQVKNSFTVL
ncbi:protein kinase [Streptomyces sp. NPDC058466]|uniref:serine/threonine-protein kinase n=1 Tax=Streptomyces sp. NPDC058466 TaxID=3346512 RepID=UPI00365017E5